MRPRRALIATAGIAVGILLPLGTLRMEWSLDLDSGLQTNERSIAWVPIRSWSEYDYRECTLWKNPLLDRSGKQVLSSCTLSLGCGDPDVETSIIRAGCRSGAESETP